jgi:signal transduction histidine kinase
VQVEGVVRDVVREQGKALLFISSGGLRFHAVLQPFPGSALPMDWLDGRVALRGVCWTDVDAENKPIGFTLYVPGTNHVLVLQKGGQDIFRQPTIAARSPAELLRQSDHRVKVVGTVAYHSPSGFVYLQREEGAVRARLLVPFARANPQARYVDRPMVIPLRPGERVELVGAPTLAHFSPLLQDAEFRRLGTEIAPVPIAAGASELFSGKFDGQLVSLKARLLGSETRQVGALKHQVLVLQEGDTMFEALWEFIGTNALPVFGKNSYLRTVGICALQLGELNQIRSFRLLLRDPLDLSLLGHPPWWERVPAGKIFVSVMTLTGVALVWIWLLRRQVSQRTGQLQIEIGERKRAQTELHHALTAEKELNEFRSRFVSMVSHEFRTPLGVILSAAENLDSYFDRLSPKQRQTQLKHVIQATRQMGKMMENVLFIGRAEAGKVEFKPSALDVAEFCTGLVQQILASTENKCPIHFQAAALPKGYADENLLRHILNNLLTNAVKYSKETAPVQLTLERSNGEAVFRVQDQGIGIPPADQRQLFQPFHRGANVGEVPGTGLGLVIVKRSVDLHGGHITCQSAEGQGTTFVVNLPLFSPPYGN